MTKGKQILKMLKEGKSNEEILASVDTTKNSINWYRSKTSSVDSQVTAKKNAPKKIQEEEYNIRNFKSMPTTDWEAFSFYLYKGDEKLGFVSDDGMGGCVNYFELPEATIEELKSLNKDKNAEYFIYDLVANFQDTKKLKRVFKTKLLFITQDKKLMEQSYKKNPDLKKKLSLLLKKENAKILNDMPFEKALKTYQSFCR